MCLESKRYLRGSLSLVFTKKLKWPPSRQDHQWPRPFRNEGLVTPPYKEPQLAKGLTEGKEIKEQVLEVGHCKYQL